MIGSNLLRYQTDQRFFIYDKETEGLNLARSRPWQVSYAICTLKEVEQIVVRHLNWPNLQVSAEAARVTRFNMQDHLRLAEDPAVVLKDFDSFLYDPQYLPVGHNVLGFDNDVHKTWRKLCGLPVDWSYQSRVLDTNALSKAYRKGFKPDLTNLCAWQYRCMHYREKGLKSSLGSMAREFGVEYDESRAHDARYDVRVNHGVLNKLVWALEI